ncbi:MAG: hypothetical protein C0171_05045 [Caldisphaera sp.]|nr:MAG: hypothetical protein C0201_02745 [Caldisphaera sp.]PMP90519.1 MAG: hypothetical protein C0171_05045 [Caldisphaera sp.]
MFGKYLLSVAIISLIALSLSIPLISSAYNFDNITNIENNNYIIVYPNSISFLFNGSNYVNNYNGNGTLGLNLLFLSGSKELTINVTKYVENKGFKVSKFEFYHNSNGGQGISNYSSIYESIPFNSSSKGYLKILANPINKLYYINLSINASWEGSLNLSNSLSNNEVFSKMLSNYNNEGSIFNSFKNYGNFESITQELSGFGVSSLINNLNITGLNITYYKINIGSNTLNITFDATFNSTEATESKASNVSMLINSLINSFLKPSYTEISSYLTVENNLLNYNLYVNTNVNITSTSMPYKFNLSKLLSNITQINQFNLSIVKKAINASLEIANYVNKNYEIVVPSSLSLNVSCKDNYNNYSLETPKISYLNNPIRSLASVDYLIGNVSTILQQNGFIEASNKVLSLNNVEVKLIGKGVTVKPNQTTIGNLSKVTVTVNNNSSSNIKQAEIGSTIAVIIVLAVVIILIKRHF